MLAPDEKIAKVYEFHELALDHVAALIEQVAALEEADSHLAEAQRYRDELLAALATYGRHLDGCTRQNMRGRCSCGFSRLFDEDLHEHREESARNG
jgi:hypothetical protein